MNILNYNEFTESLCTHIVGVTGVGILADDLRALEKRVKALEDFEKVRIKVAPGAKVSIHEASGEVKVHDKDTDDVLCTIKISR